MQEVVVPDGLAALPPGPELSAALGSIERSEIPDDRILEVLAAQYRQLCHEQARTAALLDEVGRCQGYPRSGEVSRLDTPGPYAAEETRAALRWTRRAAEHEHDLAETAVHAMPELFAAWLAGEVDRPRVVVFDRYLTGLPAPQVTGICRAAVPRAARLTTGQLAVLLRRMVLAVDPDAAARWYRKGIRERNVAAVIAPDGTVRMHAHGLPADEAEAACTRLQDLAAAAKNAGHPGLIGQIRCDLFLGMLDGRFHHMTSEQVLATLIADYRPDGPGATEGVGSNASRPASDNPQDSRKATSPSATGARPEGEPTDAEPTDEESGVGSRAGGGPARECPSDPGPVRGEPVRSEQVGIEIRAALSTLLGRDEHPGEIPGLGLLPAPDTRARVARQRRAEWRFAVTDTEGRLVSEGTTRRRPSTIGVHPVHRHGPPGGIVEIHVSVTLLHELLAEGCAAAGEWAGVLVDVAAQHARRDRHLADLDARPDDRFPHPALRRHTEIRDRTCTFPGCRHRAHTAHQDHTRDHVLGGRTTRANIGPVCGHDHDVKHRGGWRLMQPIPGTFIWRSPLGGVYETRGEFLLPDMPEPAPHDLGPRFDRPTAGVDGPILRPHRPDPPRPPPPATPELPDEPPF